MRDETILTGVCFLGLTLIATVFPWGALPFAVYLVAMAGLIWLLKAQRRSIRQRLRRLQLPIPPVDAGELQATAAQPGLSRYEATYCRVVACLTEGLPGMDDSQLRSLLRQLGELLRRGRELNTLERRLEEVLRTDSLYRLRTERELLHDRLLQATDPQLRLTLEQALAFNAERVENAEIFTTTVERLAAQEEVIAQALASIHSTLIRSRLAFSNTPAAMDALHGVVETVARINAQTRAMEQAVAEVVALRAGCH